MATIGYVTELELTEYAAARGITITGTTSVILTKALDWLELRPFKGEKADDTQALEFPRDDETTVPDKIKTAQLVAALIYDTGGDLMATIGPRVLSQSVDGAVSVSYSDKGNQSVLYPQLNALLREFLSSAGGMQFKVNRG